MRHLCLALSVLLLAGVPPSLMAAEETKFAEEKLPERPDQEPPRQERERPGPVDPEPVTRDTFPEEPQPEEIYETREEEEQNAEPSRVFKTRDRHGNVMFTDDPKGGGEEVRVGPSNTLPMSVPERAVQAPDNLKNQAQKTLDYKISINSPSQEQTFQNPGGPIPVKVTVSPEPAKGHRLVIKYDGVALEKPEIPWPQNRGTHTVSASIVDEGGNVIEAAPPRTIYIHQASKLLPPNN